MRIGLRVDVGSLRGLRQGVPNLLRLFSEYQVHATFCLPVGRDFAGRAPLRTWRERRRQGLSALSYGTLVVAPAFDADGARLAAEIHNQGHELAVFGDSPSRWIDRVAHADADWVAERLDAIDASYLGAAKHAAGLVSPGWQIHPALLSGLGQRPFTFTSMTRGRYPYLPVLQGVRSTVVEIPTTLPTADELLRQVEVTPDSLHEFLYAESRRLLPVGHVYAASADGEGLGMLPLMEKLLVMWKGQDGAVRPLGEILDDVDTARLPHHQVGWGRVPGNPGHVAMQSVQVPA